MKPLLDLNPNDCRWPVTDDRPFLFCGEPKAGAGSYCACHKRMSVSADQPVPFNSREGRRVADYLAGGKARRSVAHNADQRLPVDTMMGRRNLAYRNLEAAE